MKNLRYHARWFGYITVCIISLPLIATICATLWIAENVMESLYDKVHDGLSKLKPRRR